MPAVACFHAMLLNDDAIQGMIMQRHFSSTMMDLSNITNLRVISSSKTN